MEGSGVTRLRWLMDGGSETSPLSAGAGGTGVRAGCLPVFGATVFEAVGAAVAGAPGRAVAPGPIAAGSTEPSGIEPAGDWWNGTGKAGACAFAEDGIPEAGTEIPGGVVAPVSPDSVITGDLWIFIAAGAASRYAGLTAK